MVYLHLRFTITIVCVNGIYTTVVLTTPPVNVHFYTDGLYRGPSLLIVFTQVVLIIICHGVTKTNYSMGSLLCVSSCFFYALWIVVQVKLGNEYLFHYSSTALMCIMISLQSAVFASYFDRDTS